MNRAREDGKIKGKAKARGEAERERAKERRGREKENRNIFSRFVGSLAKQVGRKFSLSLSLLHVYIYDNSILPALATATVLVVLFRLQRFGSPSF